MSEAKDVTVRGVAALSAKATPEDVRACYRLILGREPENDEVVERHLAGGPTLAAVRMRFFNSAETRNLVPSRPPTLPLAPQRLQVEVDASPEVLTAMLARTASYWEQIGTEAPHWSVLTQDRFRPDEIPRHKAAFYATGNHDSTLVSDLLARHGMTPDELPLCVEYGCGVGRATLALANVFKRIIACDISAPHLALARKEAAARQVKNVAWHRGTQEQLMPRGRWNLWYSRLVLQHNPPPVMAHLLRLAFRGLAPGGVAIFQLPTHCIGYRFSIERYMTRPDEPNMEMHVLPQATVFALAAEARLEILEVREDSSVGARTNWLSNLFVLRRPNRS